MSASRRATLSDVARLAGVSGTTVSYIVNGRADEMRISVETQQRVRAAVAELHYRPNRSARSLRTRTTKTIGVITDFVASGMFASRMLTGANAAARALDHVLVISETEGDPVVEGLLIDEMVERQVDGLVYVTRTTLVHEPPAGRLDGRVVMLNCVDPARSMPSVLPDERAGRPRGGRGAARVGPPRRRLRRRRGPDAPAPWPVRSGCPGSAERMAESGLALSGVLPCEWAVEPAYDAVEPVARGRVIGRAG